MRFTFAAALAGAAFAFASPAFAQDTADDPGFNGVYVGAAGGYDVQPNERGSGLLFDRGGTGTFGTSLATATGANAFSPGFCNGRATAGTGPQSTTAPARCRNDQDGWAYYGRIGADAQRGAVVVGVVGEFGRSEINDSVTAFSTTPASYTFYRQIDWEATVRGRLGFTPNNSTLFYGAFGPGYAKIDRAFFTTNTANTFSQRGRRTQYGITGGGGVEQRLGRHLSFGLEYMYHHYNDDDFRVRVTQGTAAATNPFVLNAPAGTDLRRSDPNLNWHSIRATAAFRF